jgi:hypothetical protein
LGILTWWIRRRRGIAAFRRRFNRRAIPFGLSGSAAIVGRRRITPLGRSGFSRDRPFLLTTETISETVAITETNRALEGSAEPGSKVLGKGITGAEGPDDGLNSGIGSGSVSSGSLRNGSAASSSSGSGSGSFPGKELVAGIEAASGEEVCGLLLEVLDSSRGQS